MDSWLKGLIATACAVVIAGGGYFVWRDYQDRTERQRIAEQRDTQNMCNVMLSDFKSGSTKRDWRVLHIVKCVTEDYLSEEDFDDPKLRPYWDQAKASIDAARARQAAE